MFNERPIDLAEEALLGQAVNNATVERQLIGIFIDDHIQVGNSVYYYNNQKKHIMETVPPRYQVLEVAGEAFQVAKKN